MDELISRQAAIDALGEKPLAWMEGEYELGLQNQWQSDVDALKDLPFAESEQTAKFRRDGDFLRCSKCWRIVDSGYNYCPHCGVRLDWSE